MPDPSKNTRSVYTPTGLPTGPDLTAKSRPAEAPLAEDDEHSAPGAAESRWRYADAGDEDTIRCAQRAGLEPAWHSPGLCCRASRLPSAPGGAGPSGKGGSMSILHKSDCTNEDPWRAAWAQQAPGRSLQV